MHRTGPYRSGVKGVRIERSIGSELSRVEKAGHQSGCVMLVRGEDVKEGAGTVGLDRLEGRIRE